MWKRLVNGGTKLMIVTKIRKNNQGRLELTIAVVVLAECFTNKASCPKFQLPSNSFITFHDL